MHVCVCVRVGRSIDRNSCGLPARSALKFSQSKPKTQRAKSDTCGLVLEKLEVNNCQYYALGFRGLTAVQL